MPSSAPLLGVDYYPEHWPPSRWPIDARMMREAGLEVVRLAEFAWAKLEPREGELDFAWLDQAIATLADAGLRVVLGTPTAAPPAWLSRRYPDTLPVDEWGRRRDFGGRHHACPASLTYRRHVRRIVGALAKQYGRDERVIGWQIDNEYGEGGVWPCYCPNCAVAFRAWLESRYHTLEALNAAWGNVFWSQTYSAWSQINPPNLVVAGKNPSHALDYDRFSSDMLAEYQQIQIDAIRVQTRVDQFITHNFMGLFSGFDHYRMAAPLSFAAWDSYPTGLRERSQAIIDGHDAAPYAYDVGNPLLTGMAHALLRGLKDAPFWVMEQQAGAVNWGDYNPSPRPGVTRLWTWHALASGADTVVYFRWRACLYAQEQMHSGLLRHDGEPAQGYRDVLAMEKDRTLMRRVREARVANEVALLVSYDDLWALELQPHNRGLNYWGELFAYYAALSRAGVPCDLASKDGDLSRYKLVIAPAVLLADRALAARLSEFVHAGGTLVLGPRSGTKTPSNTMTDLPLPGLLSELAGATVEAWQSLPPGVELPAVLSWRPGSPIGIKQWAEALTPATARPLVAYGEGEWQGLAAATINAVGEGQVIYVGWTPDAAGADALAGWLVPQSGVESLAMVPPGVVVSRRASDGVSFIFLLNFADSPATAWLNRDGYRDAQTGESIGREVTIAARDVRVLEG